MKMEKTSYVENQPFSVEQKMSLIDVFTPVVSISVEHHRPRESTEVWKAFDDVPRRDTLTTSSSYIMGPKERSFEGKEGNLNVIFSKSLNSSDDENGTRNSLARTVQEPSSALEESSNDSDLGEFCRVSQELKDSLAALQHTFIVCDAAKPNFPIVYGSNGFFTLFGYSSKEVIGKNWRFLQGPETNETEVIKILSVLKTGGSYTGRLLNFKKDGTSFWNLLTITPVKHQNNPNSLYLIRMQVEDDGDLISVRKEESSVSCIAPGSATELIKAVQKTGSHVSDTSLVVKEEMQEFNLEYGLPKSAKLDGVIMHGGEVTKLGSKMVMSYTPETVKKNSKSDQTSSWSLRKSLSSLGKPLQLSIDPEALLTKEIEQSDNWDLPERERDIHQGIYLACTLELIEKKFLITNPRHPDNPIIYASDSFLKLTEYKRKEVVGRNFRFLQGPQTDQATVAKISNAIKEQREITVQLINYTKSGKKFWNLLHLQPTQDQKGRLQYFIGVQLDQNDHADFLLNCVSEKTEQESAKIVKAAAEHVYNTIRAFPDAVLRPEDLLEFYSEPVFPQPHNRESASWLEIHKVTSSGETIGLHHFKPIKPLGCGDTGSVHLVELNGTGEQFAMKAMEISTILNHNKVHRACIEREIMSQLDHPFLPTLYASFQTSTHVCLITDFFPGGELFDLLDKQPMKILKEENARFFAAEVVICLEYLHCLGIIYRDLKPENILLQQDGHIVLTDFDLSFRTSCEPCILRHPLHANRRSRSQLPPMCVAEPVSQSNSFVGTEEYIAPEVITGGGHTGAMDWWAQGILLYEMLYGRTPFRGKSRQKTFSNILHKDLTFPSSIQVSLAARQLINALLQRDPTSRLGSTSGANEIKRHSFFRGVNWPLIRCMPPPPLDVALHLIQKDPYKEVM